MMSVLLNQKALNNSHNLQPQQGQYEVTHKLTGLHSFPVFATHSFYSTLHTAEFNIVVVPSTLINLMKY